MTRAFVALGANMPFEGLQGSELLASAADAMRESGLPVVSCSGVWQTEAWPRDADQPDYFNAVVEIDVGDRTPRQLYDLLTAVERRFGRERRERWAPRTLDLDILAMGDAVGEFDGITVPHAHMQERAFVLAPLAEIAPRWRHPTSLLTAAELLAALPGDYEYRRIGDLSLSPTTG